jgi:alpha-tubulin suppressor-like RCC1 family protein
LCPLFCVDGNLGVGDTSNRHFPTRVESLTNQHEIVKEVHAGAEHVLAITVQGSCWTWGHGDGGRLGRGDVYDSTVPAYVSHLSTVFVSTGGAGDAHTAVVSDNGALWIWGTGSFGRLGLGDERDKCVRTIEMIVASTTCPGRVWMNGFPTFFLSLCHFIF